jgi:hypothetical protein
VQKGNAGEEKKGIDHRWWWVNVGEEGKKGRSNTDSQSLLQTHSR